MGRAKGCLLDPEGAVGTHSLDDVLGAFAGEVPSTLDLTDIAVLGRDQGNYGTCVGFGASNAATSCARQLLDPGFDLVSALGTYITARAVAGYLNDWQDGTTSASAATGLSKGGFLYEKDFPYIPSLRNQGFKLGKGQAALHRAGVKTHRIGWSSVDELWKECKRLLAAGKGIFGGWVVGDIFEQWRPSKGPWDGTPGADPGGHCMALHDYPAGLPRVLNSWGMGVGDRGFWTMTPQGLAKATSLWAVDFVPIS